LFLARRLQDGESKLSPCDGSYIHGQQQQQGTSPTYSTVCSVVSLSYNRGVKRVKGYGKPIGWAEAAVGCPVDNEGLICRKIMFVVQLIKKLAG